MNAPIRIVLASLGVSLISGCASSDRAPADLITAREAFVEARQGPAGELAQAELMDAHRALGRAEASFREDGATARTRNLAYIAARRAEIATAVAERRLAEKDKARVDAEAEAARQSTVTELKETRQQLTTEEQRRREAEQKQQIAEEKKSEAEADAAAARAALEKWAELVETERGIIITMSSGVLFASGRSEVLPEAGMRLRGVASFLRLTPGRRILVEGHTDNAGSDAFNMTLSQQRAESVRLFLAANGVLLDRMVSFGYGETKPVATNATIEGRANNRRVEIVLEPIVVRP